MSDLVLAIIYNLCDSSRSTVFDFFLIPCTLKIVARVSAYGDGVKLLEDACCQNF